MKSAVRFPRQELFGLTSQMRRCGASVGANIAEGCGKRVNNEFQRYLQISSGSASELDYHLLLARDLGFLSDVDYRRLAGGVVATEENAYFVAPKSTKRTSCWLSAKC